MNTPPPRVWQTVTLVLIVAGIILLALSGYLGPMLGRALDPIVAVQSWFSSRYQAVHDFISVPRDVNSLRERNAALESQVALLQTQIIQLQQQLSEAQVLYALLDYARARPENQYVAAAVIGRDPSPFLKYVIIDQGSDDGVRHGMPVVTQQGLVGRVDAVTAGAARVQLITDPGSIVNVRIQKSEINGQISGSVTGDLTLEMVPQDASLAVGDLVLTSGLGASYPQGVLIGQVVTVRQKESELFQSASIQPAVDFNNLQAALVIINFRPVDINSLIPTQSP
jgi:rod shape-determining protein MreC